MRNRELWTRLQAHVFDGSSSAPFSVKLARVQGWSHGNTERAVKECRRFLYFTQVSLQQFTPNRRFAAAEAGSFHFQGVAFLLFFSIICIGGLDLPGGIESVTLRFSAMLLGVLVVFRWAGFGPRPRSKTTWQGPQRGRRWGLELGVAGI